MLIQEEKEPSDFRSRNSQQVENTQHLKTTASTAGGLMSARADVGKTLGRYKIEKCVEDVLESAVDPEEWKKECDRVEKQLVYPLR